MVLSRTILVMGKAEIENCLEREEMNALFCRKRIEWKIPLHTCFDNSFFNCLRWTTELEGDADDEEIKTAYRRLAKYYHPDGMHLHLSYLFSSIVSVNLICNYTGCGGLMLCLVEVKGSNYNYLCVSIVFLNLVLNANSLVCWKMGDILFFFTTMFLWSSHGLWVFLQLCAIQLTCDTVLLCWCCLLKMNITSQYIITVFTLLFKSMMVEEPWRKVKQQKLDSSRFKLLMNCL